MCVCARTRLFGVSGALSKCGRWNEGPTGDRHEDPDEVLLDDRQLAFVLLAVHHGSKHRGKLVEGEVAVVVHIVSE